MTENELLELFQKTGALLSGHFLLTSGLHSQQYFQCAKVLQNPLIAERLCSQIAANFVSRGPQVVIAPAVGGIIVAHEVARALKIRAVFGERADGVMKLRRGFAIEKGEAVLIVEDVITTGGSVREIVQLVMEHGGQPVGIGCLVDRSGGQVNFDLEFYSLGQLRVESTSPGSCPQCAQGLPLVKPGSRATP